MSRAGAAYDAPGITGNEVAALNPRQVTIVEEAERFIALLEQRMAGLSHKIDANRARMADGEYIDPKKHAGAAYALFRIRAKLAKLVERREWLRAEQSREARAEGHQALLQQAEERQQRKA